MIERRVYELSTTATVCGYSCPADCTACRHPYFLVGVFSMQLWVWSNRVCDVTDVNDTPWKLTYLLNMDGWKLNFPFKNSPFLDIFCYIFSVKKDVFLLHISGRVRPWPPQACWLGLMVIAPKCVSSWRYGMENEEDMRWRCLDWPKIHGFTRWAQKFRFFFRTF